MCQIIFWWISCCCWFQLAIKSTIIEKSINMSHQNTRSPEDVFIAPVIVHLRACTQVANVMSITCSACLNQGSSCVFMMMQRILPSFWCINLHMMIDCRLFTVVSESKMECLVVMFWNFRPMNSPPLSWIHQFGLGYLNSGSLLNCYAILQAILLLIWISSTRLVIGSIQVKV